MHPVLALDIGGTKLAVGVVTPDGRTHGVLVEPTRRDEGPALIIPRLFDMGRRVLESVAVTDGITDVAAVGISCGGPLDATTGVLTNPLHLPGWIDIPIVDLARDAFDLPVVLENDATAAALGEYRYGSGIDTDTMLYLTVSTGIGGGAVVNGRLHRGAAGNGGEYGHIMVRPGGRACLCGRRGCLEVYASGTSIENRAAEALATWPGTTLLTAAAHSAADVSVAAQQGDELASLLWTETTELLAQAITDLVNVFEPDLVVVGGGVTRSGSMLLDPVRTAVLRDAMRPAAQAVRIELAALGDEVCVVGAGALAFDLLEELTTV